MSHPLVSAIIPTYNRAEMTLRAARSVFAQTYPAVELIVVDDGSVDGTEQRLRDQLGDRFRYIRQTNQGVSAARNRGVGEASGEFIAFLDSDDEWLPEKTAAQIGHFAKHPDFGLVVCDFFIIDPAGDLVSTQHRREQYGEGGHVLERLLGSPLMVPSTAMLRASVYQELGGFDPNLRTAEDIDLHLRIAARFPIGLVEEPLVRYLRGHDSLSEDSSSYTDYVNVIRHFVETNGSAISKRLARDAVYAAQLKLARGLMWRGERRSALIGAARCVPYISRPSQVAELSALTLRLAAYTVLRRRWA